MSQATKKKARRQKGRDGSLGFSESIDAVTRYLRPREDVTQAQFFCALLDIIDRQPDDAAREKIIMYIFTAFPFIRGSGALTAPSAYPALLKGVTDEYVGHTMHGAEDGVHAAFTKAAETLEGTPHDAQSLARFAVRFLRRFTDPRVRIHALLHLIPLHQAVAYPTPPLAFDGESITEEEFDRVAWVDREFIAAALYAEDQTTAITGTAEVLWNLGSTIQDPRRRAIVLGHVLARIIDRLLQKKSMEETLGQGLHMMISRLG